MQTRILHTKFWQDEFIGELTPTEKLLFIYFLTNDLVNIIHCYECPDRKILFDTGVTKDQLDKAKQKFHDRGKILFGYGYVYLYNAGKYETYTGDRNDIAKNRLFSQLPDNIKSLIDTPIDRGMQGVYIPTINHKSEIINKKSEFNIDIIKEVLYKEFPDIKKDVLDENVYSMSDWLKSEGKTKKDYVAFARNWVRRSKNTIKNDFNNKIEVIEVIGG